MATDDLNAQAINGVINVSRHRPHPLSTVHDYTSWTSLTDQRWSARHLPPKKTTNLPKTEDLLELFRQQDENPLFCDKSTLLFPTFAQYLTDGFIRTRMPDAGEPEEVRLQNTSNHQIDMCPLYGRLPRQTEALRLRSENAGERGRLKSQLIEGEEFSPFLFDNGMLKEEFAVLDKPLGMDSTLGDTPSLEELRARIFAFGGDRTNAVPQIAMMNTLFLREHNRLAGEIEQNHPQWNDERVFQTARNTVIVLFIKIVVEEYINHISPRSLYRLDPSVAWDAPWNKPNWITTEFSLLYRWHSLVPNAITWNGHDCAVEKTFMNNKLLLDAGLRLAFTDISGQRAGRLGPFNTPDPLLGLEARAIDQGRLGELAPYTDYREYVSLPRPRHFDDVSRDVRVVDFLRNTYGRVEDVEFYVGLFAEDPVPNSPLPPLMLRMVGVDAFSQALTNPLLSKYVFKEDTFSAAGWKAIHNTSRLRDIVDRNTRFDPSGDLHIGLTLPDWEPVVEGNAREG
ncbi:prostaglandin-endoperoxide synthase 2 [Nitrosospira briensis]|uniref:Prostaglandin-endoperoxide synthase 2 n=1 Tax=Nitrosospira briensis TaxID=35799 RepID=A0A1I5A9J4_9PROT|nr:peroxidase family protein [Nitrosospira briensis]SFN58829.1 prostaglandin-endoperoxide synthase 2 [Nitrosospira briensis]